MRASTVPVSLTAFALCLGLCGSLTALNRNAWAKDQPPKTTPKAEAGASEKEKGDGTKPTDASLMKLIILPEADPDVGPPPLTVHFTVEVSEVSDPENPKYTWDFGDKSPESHEQAPTHTYKKPGDYKVLIKITDTGGRSGEDDLLITVENPNE